MKFIDTQRDPWQTLPADSVQPDGEVTGHWLLSLAQWRHWRLALDAVDERPAMADGLHPAHMGVLLPNDADERELLPDLPRLSLVALQFPKWTDGRAYSQARTLRARLGFGGEIRATGEVLADMLPLLQRTGFDAVQLRADQRLDSAQRALRFFARHYQGDTLEPVPSFRREPLAA
jgi:uncharacterized protein (DUF934 family)